MSIKRATWQEFRDSGLLWWTNRILHTVGWCIVTEVDQESGVITDAYPARTNWLGFSEAVDEEECGKFRMHVSQTIATAGVLTMDGAVFTEDALGQLADAAARDPGGRIQIVHTPPAGEGVSR